MPLVALVLRRRPEAPRRSTHVLVPFHCLSSLKSPLTPLGDPLATREPLWRNIPPPLWTPPSPLDAFENPSLDCIPHLLLEQPLLIGWRNSPSFTRLNGSEQVMVRASQITAAAHLSMTLRWLKSIRL